MLKRELRSRRKFLRKPKVYLPPLQRYVNLPTFNFLLIKLLLQTCASTSLATTSSELESLRSAHKDLEAKLKVAEENQELVEKQLAEKNSEFIREKVDLVEKRRKDSATLKNL
jgi:hypothetical protein